MGRTYVPVMLANAKAIDQGLEKVETVVEGKTWEQVPFPYQAKCLQWIRIEFSRLSSDEQEQAHDASPRRVANAVVMDLNKSSLTVAPECQLTTMAAERGSWANTTPMTPTISVTLPFAWVRSMPWNPSDRKIRNHQSST